jgi:hypothetical protein
MNETSEQNRQQYFEEVKSELKNIKCHTEKMRGRLNCIKGRIASFHILYFSARILLLT